MKEKIITYAGAIALIFMLGMYIGCLILCKAKYDLLEENTQLRIELNNYKNIVEELKQNE